MRCGRTCGHKAWDLRCERGGGSDPQPASIIAAPQAPNYQQTASDVAQAQLKYNPDLARQNADIQMELGPRYAQSQYDIQSKYAPLYRALIEQQFPQVGTLAQQTQQGLTNPSGLSDVQQQGQDAIRNRQRMDLSRAINTQSNIGGNLYGGHNLENNIRGQTDLSNQYANSDIQLQQQQRAQTMQELLSLFQMAGFNVQQPGNVGMNAGVTQGTDSLYNSLVQNNGNFGIIPGTQGSPSPAWGLAGQGIGAAGSVAAAKMFVMCLPGTTEIDTPDGPRTIASLEAGDAVDGGIVSYRASYMPQSTVFVQLSLDDGSTIETCDLHVVEGQPLMAYAIGDRFGGRMITEKRVQIRIERTFDLLTTSVDGGYRVQGLRVASMIPLLHRIANALATV